MDMCDVDLDWTSGVEAEWVDDDRIAVNRAGSLEVHSVKTGSRVRPGFLFGGNDWDAVHAGDPDGGCRSVCNMSQDCMCCIKQGLCLTVAFV